MALFKDDPIGINMGWNADEYDSVTGTILPALKTAKSVGDVELIVHEEFCGWFGVESVGEKEKYHAVSQLIWEAWREFQTHST